MKPFHAICRERTPQRSSVAQGLGAHEDDEEGQSDNLNDSEIDPSWAVMSDLLFIRLFLVTPVTRKFPSTCHADKAWVKASMVRLHGDPYLRQIVARTLGPLRHILKWRFTPSDRKLRRKPAGRPRVSRRRAKIDLVLNFGDEDGRNARRPYSAPATLRQRRRSRDALGGVEGHTDRAHSGSEFQLRNHLQLMVFRIWHEWYQSSFLSGLVIGLNF